MVVLLLFIMQLHSTPSIVDTAFTRIMILSTTIGIINKKKNKVTGTDLTNGDRS